MARAIRKREGENLDVATITKVIELLCNETPISKKEACSILNITYNTTRLARIIDEFEKHLAYVKERKKYMRGKPVESHEKQEMVQSYLSGETISSIAEATYRSVAIVRQVLNKYNVPERLRGTGIYFKPAMIIEEGIKEDYKVGDLVFAVRYNNAATVKGIHSISDTHGTIYKLWVHGDRACNALQPYYELADLRKAQKDLDLTVQDLSGEEVQKLLFEAWVKSKKGKKDE